MITMNDDNNNNDIDNDLITAPKLQQKVHAFS